MSSVNQDYQHEDTINFLKEELERIASQHPRQAGASLLTEAQAFAVWFLHQETGLDYEEANECILDDTNDCGVDFIFIDKKTSQILIGQVEYDTSSWSRTPANQRKATDTFEAFNKYLNESILPDRLHESARPIWREAKKLANDNGYQIRYLFATPKHFSRAQEQTIRKKTGLDGYEFFTHDVLIERGHEFLDGQTGVGSFTIPYAKPPLEIEYDFGKVYVMNVPIKAIHQIVNTHQRSKRLKALFASNVRSYLNIRKRSKDIGDAMRKTILNEPDRFLVYNNGITIQCSKTTIKNGTLLVERASISNGCQTAMNIYRFYKEHEGTNPSAEVLVSVIELRKDAPHISGEIARARNNQNPVDNRDLRSNHPLLVTLHHRLSADRLAGSEKRYYLLRKQGEKQTILLEEPNAKGKYEWIDADVLARRISAVIRQDPYISQQGANLIFGEKFSTIFPNVQDPSHTRCKYAYWLIYMIDKSYETYDKWRGKTDKLIEQDGDFKNVAQYVIAAIIARELKEQFSFNDAQEKRFAESCEKARYARNSDQYEEFRELTYKAIDDAYHYLHVICHAMLGKKLPRAREPYRNYENLLKGPTYEHILVSMRRGDMKGYRDRFRKSLSKIVNYLKMN